MLEALLLELTMCSESNCVEERNVKRGFNVKYKISLTTYNVDVIEAFSSLGNKKSQYIEQALLNFLGTTKGKDTLRLMEHTGKNNHNAVNDKRTRSEQNDQVEQEPGGINVDSFLK